MQWAAGLSRRSSGRDMALTSHSHVEPNRKNRTILVLPHYASMAGYRVNFTVPFFFLVLIWILFLFPLFSLYPVSLTCNHYFVPSKIFITKLSLLRATGSLLPEPGFRSLCPHHLPNAPWSSPLNTEAGINFETLGATKTGNSKSYPETLVRICQAAWHLTPENPRTTLRISNLTGVNRRTSDWNFCMLESTVCVVWRIRLQTEGGPCYNSVISVDRLKTNSAEKRTTCLRQEIGTLVAAQVSTLISNTARPYVRQPIVLRIWGSVTDWMFYIFRALIGCTVLVSTRCTYK